MWLLCDELSFIKVLKGFNPDHFDVTSNITFEDGTLKNLTWFSKQKFAVFQMRNFA